IFTDGSPGGESPEQVEVRVDRVIAKVRAAEGNVALFSHGHLLRALAARWIGLRASDGRRFLLDTATLCVMSYYRDSSAIRRWNVPIVEVNLRAGNIDTR